jgi:predicted signal transduction protein with EAL and GGDEF domain
MLQQLARLFDKSVRETDIVTRYGGEEFVVVMPETDLEGACVFCERLRCCVEASLRMTVSAGLAAAIEGDTPRTMLARADAALYSAKTAGRNLVFRHTGTLIEAGAVSSPRSKGESTARIIPMTEDFRDELTLAAEVEEEVVAAGQV